MIYYWIYRVDSNAFCETILVPRGDKRLHTSGNQFETKSWRQSCDTGYQSPDGLPLLPGSPYLQTWEMGRRGQTTEKLYVAPIWRRSQAVLRWGLDWILNFYTLDAIFSTAGQRVLYVSLPLIWFVSFLGMRFAFMEMKFVLAKLLTEFELDVSSKTQLPAGHVILGFVGRLDRPVYVQLKKIKTWENKNPQIVCIHTYYNKLC